MKENKIDYYEIFNAPRLTTEQWVTVLEAELSREKGFNFVEKVLIEAYKSDNHVIFCRQFEKEHNMKALNWRVGEFRDRIKKVIPNIPEQIREESGTDRAWNIPFYSIEELNKQTGWWSWVLRPELVEAMEIIMPFIKEFKNIETNIAPIEFYDTSILSKEYRIVPSTELLCDIVNSTVSSYPITFPQKPNYEEINKRKKLLGDSGEKKVVRIEKESLIKIGKKDLANQVKVVDSDVLGYDIDSFYPDGTEKHIEVKTSSQGGGFYITSNEVNKFMSDNKYELYYLTNTNSKTISITKFSNYELRTEIYNRLEAVSFFVPLNKNK